MMFGWKESTPRLLAVLKVTEGAGGGDRENYFVLVWDSPRR